MDRKQAIASRLVDFLTRPSFIVFAKYHRIKHKDFKGYWVTERKACALHEAVTAKDIVVLYVHGGGFIVGDALMYNEWLLDLVKHFNRGQNGQGSNAVQKRLHILAVDFTRAPKARFPRQVDEVEAAYRYVAGLVPPEQMLVMSDMSGTGPALQTICRMVDKEKGQIAGNIMMSPMIDQRTIVGNVASLSLPHSYRQSSSYDIIDAAYLEKCLDNYLPEGADAAQMGKVPRVSPALYHDTVLREAFANAFVAHSECEILRSDQETFIQRLRGLHINVETMTEDKHPHDWPCHVAYCKTRLVYEKGVQKVTEWIGRVA